MADRPVRPGRRAARRNAESAGARKVNYRRLRNPFAPQGVFSEDRVEAIHQTALRVLEDLGMRVLLPEGRRRLRDAGALVDEETMMVRIGRDIVEAGLAAAPRSFELRGGTRARDVLIEPGSLCFFAGSGCPNVTDLDRGRRPGTQADFEELLKLIHGFDALHCLGPAVESQDVPPHFRHYAVTRAQLTLSDKVPFVYSRGTPQARESFEMLRILRGLDEAAFRAEPWCTTVINTNSPRQLDIPMTQGIIDFAEAGQLLILTPFCLAGAMAPVTVAGALTLQHAEALACIALAQIVRPGAPVTYGGFSSNVDMKSGAPAFGTPEHVQMELGSGQLARRIGMPWRSAAGTASNMADAQGAEETAMSLWGSVLAGATMIIHAAGWLEGGLTLGYEKLINDMEAVQTFAELCAGVESGDDAIGFEAIAEVQPGGHFFAAKQTMERYETAFYAPLVAERANYGRWAEAGGLSSEARATEIWKRQIAEHAAPDLDPGRLEEMDAFVSRRMDAGGAPPES